MCDKCLKKIFYSDLSDEEKLKEAEEWTIKEMILDKLNEAVTIGTPISEFGLTSEDFEKLERFDIDEDDLNIGLTKFKKKDKFGRKSYYIYESNAYGSKGYGANSRDFCINLVRSQRKPSGDIDRVFTYRDILSITPNPGLGQEGSNIYSVFRYRGGKNCKHFWKKVYITIKDGEGALEDAKDQPNQPDKGSVGGAPE